MYKVIIIALLY